MLTRVDPAALASRSVPTLNRAQAREIDRRAVEQLGVPSLLLMENAGRGVVDLMEQIGIGGPVTICCGKGNNAGDGLVIARHLVVRGYVARVFIWGDESNFSGDARTNFDICRRMGLAIESFSGVEVPATLREPFRASDWIVDALLGTGAQGEVRPPLDDVIRTMNECGVRKLAVDLPSGLDCDTGEPAQTTVMAKATCTFVAVKQGFTHPAAAAYLGDVYVLDIGVPAQLATS